MLKIKIVLAILLFAIFSCTNKKKYSYELKCDTNSEFIVSLDSITPPDTKMTQFFDYESKDKPLCRFAMLNYESQCINFHNDQGKKISEIRLRAHDSALPKTTGFYFINTDSLLLYSYSAKELRLISCSNKFKSQLLFNLDSLKNPAISKLDIEITSKSPIFYKNGIIYLTGRALLNNDISLPQSKKINTAISYSIPERKADFISEFEKVWEERYWHFEQYFVNHTFVPNQNTIIYSLSMKDSILLYNFQNKNQVKISVQSDEFVEKEMLPKKISDPSVIGSVDDTREYVERPRYGEVIYDRYRNTYYRFITVGLEKRVTRVIICDNNLKKIGETKLPQNYMAGSGFLVAKDGLYLRNCSIKNENKIVYTLFKLIKTS